MKETVDTMLSYVRQKRFTKEQLSEVSYAINGATAKKLIEWGIIYDLDHDKEAFAETVGRQQQNPVCPDILREDINNNVYKRDYEDVTMGLLFVPVSYDTVVQSLHKILDSKLWD